MVGSGTNPNRNQEAWIAHLTPALPGDFNNNGTGDASDYVMWRKTDGTPADYDTWRAHFGETAASGAGVPSLDPLSATVPEPASGLLLIAAATFSIIIRRFTVYAPKICPSCAGIIAGYDRRHADPVAD